MAEAESILYIRRMKRYILPGFFTDSEYFTEQEGFSQQTIQGGSSSVYIKAVSSSGQESYTRTIYVQTSLNPYIPDFVILVIVIFLLVMLVFVLVPLLGKWINSDKK